MREVYREVSALFGDVDLVLGDAGWSPVWYGNLLRQHGYTPGTAKDLTLAEHRSVLAEAPHFRIIAWPLTQMTHREVLKQTVLAELTQDLGATGSTK
jgi:hypothetical protein